MRGNVVLLASPDVFFENKLLQMLMQVILNK